MKPNLWRAIRNDSFRYRSDGHKRADDSASAGGAGGHWLADLGGFEVKNTLNDLNNHLFAQLERLGDEDIKGEALQEELGRAKAVSDIATQIINNGGLVLKAATFAEDYGLKSAGKTKQLPPMLRGDLLNE